MATSVTTPTRERLIRAAAELLSAGGRDAVSTRAVSAAAGVQAPTMYRLFGDKEGLLDAVAAHGFEQYLASKSALGETDDPVEDLRRGWDLHVGFGLAQPAFYVLMYGDARPGGRSAAQQEAAAMLHRMVSRVAAAGRLRMSVERAAQLVHATGLGVTLHLIATAPTERDPEVSAIARETVIRAIVTDTTDAAPPVGQATELASRAVGLKAALTAASPETGLSAAEQAVLIEWLDRISDAPAIRPRS